MVKIATNTSTPSPAQADSPKSYLPKEEREDRLRAGDMYLLYMAEGRAACDEGDMDSAWSWMARAKLHPSTLKMIKEWNGPNFIKDKGFDTSLADAEYGSNWLEHE